MRPGLLRSLCAVTCWLSCRAEKPVQPPAADPAEEVFRPIQARLERDLCQSPDPALTDMLRKVANEPADCDRSEVRTWRVKVGSREAIIWRTRSREMPVSGWSARGAMVDGRLVIEAPPQPPFWSSLGDLSGLGGEDAQAFLEALAVTGPSAPPGIVHWETALTPGEADFLGQRYPRAAPVMKEHPPGFGRDESGWHLRAYAITPAMLFQGPSTFQCPVISRMELSVGNAGLAMHPLDTRALEDAVNGRPCR